MVPAAGERLNLDLWVLLNPSCPPPPRYSLSSVAAIMQPYCSRSRRLDLYADENRKANVASIIHPATVAEWWSRDRPTLTPDEQPTIPTRSWSSMAEVPTLLWLEIYFFSPCDLLYLDLLWDMSFELFKMWFRCGPIPIYNITEQVEL